MPHSGQLADLKRWWDQFDDPLLSELIAAGQQVSPTLASARARIENARATGVAAGAALGPKLDLSLSANKGQQDLRFPEAQTATASLPASWEIDLFGANSAGSDAASARLRGAEAEWHAARISVAAEIANSYIALRACEAQLVQARIDAASRKETARLAHINLQAGLESPANAALARASAAQANSLAVQQQAQCEIQTKVLVALTAIDEPALREKLGKGEKGRIPQPTHISVEAVPAAVLAQRPDIFSATQTVLAASAEVTQLQALRYPRISIAGSIGHSRFESDYRIIEGQTWSIGPISITLPIFDGGTRSANVTAGRARYDEAASQYAYKLRNAIREVEEAMINLDSSAIRSADAGVALTGYGESFKGVEARQRHGLASLFELEDARRSLSRAQSTLIDLQRERVTAWIHLYRALGGGWTAPAQTADSPQEQPS